MKWCTISSEYLEELKRFESRIPNYNYTKIREDGSSKKLLKPFFYALYEVEDMVYVGQVNHYQKRHNRLPESLDFKKIFDPNNPRLPLCVVNLNYMFPVPKSEIQDLEYADIDSLRDFDNDRERSQYIRLLQKELAEIVKKNLHVDAAELYNLKNSNPNHPISRRSFDFTLLEQKCLEWIAKQGTNKNILTEQDLLKKNKKVRYKEAEPSTLIGSTFRMDGEEFIIQDLELLPGQTKDVATLKRISDGQIFQDKDFASTKPFKLNLQSPTQTKNLVHHNSKIK